MDNKSFARIAVWILVAVVLFTVFRQFETNSTQSLDTTSYTQFMDDAKAGKIRRVDIQGRRIIVTPQQGAEYTLTSPGDLWMVDDLRKSGVQVYGKAEEEPSFLTTIFVSWFPMLLLIGVWIFFMRRMQGGAGGGGAFSFGKSKARMITEQENQLDDYQEQLAQLQEEIAALTWDQVQFEDNALTLPDRTVPLAPSAEDCLRERYRLYAQRDPHVIISDRYQRPMPPESVSRLARTALDTEGQKVSLKDLRQDFVIRQLQTHDWTYAARVSGMAVSTLRGSFSQYFQERQSAAPELPPDSEYLLWRIVQQEGSSVVGLALWMGWKLQMQPGEILNLTWSQVDLDRGLLRLPDREIPMGSRLSRLLGDVCGHRKDPAQDRVLLTPGTGKPMDLARLSTVIRTALIRGGLEQLSLGDLSRLSRRGSQRQTVLARLSAVGSMTREEVMDLLGVSKSAALKLLNQLRQDGAVVRIGGCYYPAGAVVLPEDQSAAVTAYLAAHGTAVRKELAELLNLPPAQCTALLRRMADRGELLLTGKRYALPPQKKPLETN